jgi:tRNA pseudouridine38-40 synthase
MRYVIGLEYDGSAFQGWQSQLSGNTVQDALQRALSSIAGKRVMVHAAGRTDAGVHALAQVVHFDTDVERPLNAWVRGCNAHLPETVAVRWAQPVSADFHARFSARARSYRYVLLNRAVRPALMHHQVGWHHAALDAAVMQQAAEHLLGEHDFSSFRAAECQALSPVKTMHSARIERDGEYVLCDFRANAFLHHMVRNLVGALVYVGDGRRSPDWMADLLQARDRRLGAPTFSAAGLYLSGVEYDPGWQLPGGGRIMAPLFNPGADDVANPDQDLRADPQR